MTVKWCFVDLSLPEGRLEMLTQEFGAHCFAGLRAAGMDCVLCGNLLRAESGARGAVLCGWTGHRPGKDVVISLCRGCRRRFATFEDAARQVVKVIDGEFGPHKEQTQAQH